MMMRQLFEEKASRRERRERRGPRLTLQLPGDIIEKTTREGKHMIFYFSGTGNSYQAARAVCAPGEEPLDLAKCLREGERSFHLGPGEALGFVCPV